MISSPVPAWIVPALLGFLIGVSVLDIVLHVATDRVEPLRVSANGAVILGAALLLLIPRLRRPAAAIALAVIVVVLNAIVIATTGIGIPGLVFIALAVVPLLALAALTRPRASARS